MSTDVARLAHELKGPPKPREFSQTAEAILKELCRQPNRTGPAQMKMSTLENVAIASQWAVAHALYELQDAGAIAELYFTSDGISCQAIGRDPS